jgi:hypothetical protein
VLFTTGDNIPVGRPRINKPSACALRSVKHRQHVLGPRPSEAIAAPAQHLERLFLLELGQMLDLPMMIAGITRSNGNRDKMCTSDPSVSICRRSIRSEGKRPRASSNVMQLIVSSLIIPRNPGMKSECITMVSRLKDASPPAHSGAVSDSTVKSVWVPNSRSNAACRITTDRCVYRVFLAG